MASTGTGTICLALILLSTISASFGKLSKCLLELKSAKIDKAFRQDFLIRRIHFPIGQILQFGAEADAAASEFPPMKSGERPKCFRIYIKSDAEKEGESGISSCPFNCIRNEHSGIFCHLNTSRSSPSDSGHFPFSLWGNARVAKTDNRNYMLVVSCNSNERPSWILMHRSDKISAELEKETLDYIEGLGFGRGDTFGKGHLQKMSLMFMDFEPKCPMNAWPPQVTSTRVAQQLK